MVSVDLGTLVDVRLLKLPVAVWARTQQHTDELLREFVLVSQQLHHDDPTAVSAPVRLTRLVEELSEGYGSFSEEQQARLFDAAAAGEMAIDLTYQVPVAAGAAARHLGELLDEADAYCRSGEHLLTLETPGELVRFRDWYLGEFIRQTAGAPPLPWPAYTG
ncbi:MAG TPA: hypothetical protein VHE57_09035 [Mycobacteriales bacterium]|nr:hypothetical protein [Mycobacteriales bacterium]